MDKSEEFERDDSKYNAGIDAEKRVMALFKDIDRTSLGETGEMQKTKYILIKQLVIAVRGMFNDKNIRSELWKDMLNIKLLKGNTSTRQGRTNFTVMYSPDVDLKLDELVMKITDYLQDEKGFFSPEGDEPGL